MTQEQDAAEIDLTEEIANQQESVDSYLDDARPRFSRLTMVSILGSALAAALTAGPAMGGPPFTEQLRAILSLSEQSTVWRMLCLGATLVSIAAAVAVNLMKADDLSARVAAAEAARTHLQALRIRLGGDEDTPKARDELADIVTSVPFIDTARRRHTGWQGLLLPVALAAVIAAVSISGLH